MHSIIDIVWMVWVFSVGVLERLIQRFNPYIHLVIEEDKWKIRWIKLK